MDATIYDTKEGIVTILRTLEDLNNLVKARREASYSRNERLHEFWILGRFQTDTVGNFESHTMQYFPSEVYPEIPPVLTNEEFYDLVGQRGLTQPKVDLGHPRNNLLLLQIPPAHVVDPVNGEAWTIVNCHEAYPVETHETINIASHAGKTLREALQALKSRKDADYSYKWAKPFVTNKAYRDLTEKHHKPKNERGVKYVSEDYVVQPGDAIDVSVTRFYHADTYKAYLAEEHAKQFTAYQEELQEYLSLCEFTDIRIAAECLPLYLLDELFEMYESSKPETEAGRQSFVSRVQYFSVETNEGSFGILPSEYPLVNLKPTGITIQELCDALGAPVNTRERPQQYLVPLPHEERDMLRFRQILLRRKNQGPAPS